MCGQILQRYVLWFTLSHRSPPQAALIRYVCMYRIILDTLVLEEPTFSHLAALVSDILKYFDTEIGIPYNKGNLYHVYLTEGSIRFKKKDKHTKFTWHAYRHRPNVGKQTDRNTSKAVKIRKPCTRIMPDQKEKRVADSASGNSEWSSACSGKDGGAIVPTNSKL